MANERKKTSAASAALEWTGGLGSLVVDGVAAEDVTCPDVLFWMEGELMVGSDVALPGAGFGVACESLGKAMLSPKRGEARQPARLRVASEALAEVLRAGHPELEVVVGATPLVDGLIEEMVSSMDAQFADDDSFDDDGFDEDPDYAVPVVQDVSAEEAAAAVGSYFEGAAALLRTEPWTLFPELGGLFHLRIPELGVEDGVLSVALNGPSVWLVVFSTLESFEAYVDLEEMLDEDMLDNDVFGSDELVQPPRVTLSFEHKDEINAEVLEEISARGFEVLGESGYPEWLSVGLDDVATPASAEQVKCVDAATRALVQMLAAPELPASWAGEAAPEPISRRYSVETHHGTSEVELISPFQPAEMPFDVMAALSTLDLDADQGNGESPLRERLEDQLFDLFEESPEGESPPLGTRGVATVLDLAAEYLGHTVATMSADGLDAVIARILPQQVMLPATGASALVKELHAFYSFLKREFQLPQADACLSVLSDATATKLAEALVKAKAERSRKAKVNKAQEAKRKSKRKASRKARRKKR